MTHFTFKKLFISKFLDFGQCRGSGSEQHPRHCPLCILLFGDASDFGIGPECVRLYHSCNISLQGNKDFCYNNSSNSFNVIHFNLWENSISLIHFSHYWDMFNTRRDISCFNVPCYIAYLRFEKSENQIKRLKIYPTVGSSLHYLLGRRVGWRGGCRKGCLSAPFLALSFLYPPVCFSLFLSSVSL